MKLFLRTILPFLLLATLNNADETPITEIAWAPQRVVVHESGALVHSVTTVNLVAGSSIFHLFGLSRPTTDHAKNFTASRLEETSLTAVVSAPKESGLACSVDKVSWEDITSPWPEQRYALSKQMFDQKRRLVALEKNHSDLSRSIALYNQLCDSVVSGKEATKERFETAVQALALREKHLPPLLLSLREVETAIEDLKSDIQLLETAFQGMTREVKRAAVLHVSCQQHEPQLPSDPSVECKLELSQIVLAASWRPHYELQLDSKTETVSLRYMAEVEQLTLVDWINVSVELALGSPSTNRFEPELEPLVLSPRHRVLEDFNRAPSSSERRYRKNYMQAAQLEAFDRHKAGVADAFGENQEDGLYEEIHRRPNAPSSNVDSSGEMVRFVLPAKYSVSRTASARLTVANVEALKSTLIRTATPRLSSRVFLSANITNNSPYDFVSGPSLVFVDGSFLSASTLPTLQSQASTRVALGVDAAFTVSRAAVSHSERAEGGWMTSKRVSVRRLNRIKIESRKAKPVTVIVKDQIPISNDEAIVVTVAPETRKALMIDMDKLREESPEKAREVPLNAQGRLRWTVTVPAGGSESLSIDYEISHPSGVHIGGE